MKEIGTFKELKNNNDKYPAFEATPNEIPEKKIILEYLEGTPSVAVAPAIVKDIFTGERLKMELFAKSDGIYIWSSDIAYYFDKYNLKLPKEFIEHVLKQKKRATF